MQQNTNKMLQKQAQAELIRQTKNAMMNHQDSAMWSLCNGVLEQASVTTAQNAALEGDGVAAEVLSKYIAYLEEML